MCVRNRRFLNLRRDIGGYMMKKVVIIGGVAGGDSVAARIQRLDEQAEIVMASEKP